MFQSIPSRFVLALNFGLVYVFWGSTYLGIDIAVKHIPPALMCATRFTIAGVIMLGYCLLRRQKILYNWRQLLQLAIVGNLLLMGGNLTLSYAEQYIPSGLAALLVASIPLWFVVLDGLLIGHQKLSSRGLVSLALGFAGTLVLLWPKLSSTAGLGRREFWWSIALLGGSLSWAFGSGLGNWVFALSNHDLSRVVWTTRGIAAVAYLVVGGSLIGYTAYIYILGHAPTAKVSTYAYVNPVVAVFLGWLVLGEHVDAYILAGSAIVVASVVLVTSAPVTRKKAESPAALQAVAD